MQPEDTGTGDMLRAPRPLGCRITTRTTRAWIMWRMQVQPEDWRSGAGDLLQRPPDQVLGEVEQVIGYRFRDRNVLRRALWCARAVGPCPGGVEGTVKQIKNTLYPGDAVKEAWQKWDPGRDYQCHRGVEGAAGARGRNGEPP